MPIRNILVALDGTPPSDKALGAAVFMQKAYGAHVTGYVAMHETLRAGDHNTWLPAAIRKSVERATTETMDRIEEAFATATGELPQDKVHLIERRDASDTSVAEASRFFDLSLVGIPAQGSRHTALHPDRIALLSGRPVMAFPAQNDASRVAARVMVAWDGKPGSGAVSLQRNSVTTNQRDRDDRDRRPSSEGKDRDFWA